MWMGRSLADLLSRRAQWRRKALKSRFLSRSDLRPIGRRSTELSRARSILEIGSAVHVHRVEMAPAPAKATRPRRRSADRSQRIARARPRLDLALEVRGGQTGRPPRSLRRSSAEPRRCRDASIPVAVGRRVVINSGHSCRDLDRVLRIEDLVATSPKTMIGCEAIAYEACGRPYLAIGCGAGQGGNRRVIGLQGAQGSGACEVPWRLLRGLASKVLRSAPPVARRASSPC